MAEVFGVVAAATQLAGACLSLIDLMAKIKGATGTLLRYQHQFQELHNLSLSISQNPLLQTDEVFSHTQSLLLFIQHISLEPLLQKGLVSRTWGLLRRDQYLAETSKVLEQRKSSLSLIISDIQARALYDIRSNLRSMSDSSTEATLSEYPPDKPLRTDLFDETLTRSSTEMSKRKTKTPPRRLPPTDPESDDDFDYGYISIRENLRRVVNKRINESANDDMSVWSGQRARAGVPQRNGHQASDTGYCPGGTSIWDGNIKEGDEPQINWSDRPPGTYTHAGGASWESPPAGDSSVPRSAVLHVYQGNEHRGGTTAEGETVSDDKIQINGYDQRYDTRQRSPASDGQSQAQEQGPQGQAPMLLAWKDSTDSD